MATYDTPPEQAFENWPGFMPLETPLNQLFQTSVQEMVGLIIAADPSGRNRKRIVGSLGFAAVVGTP